MCGVRPIAVQKANKQSSLEERKVCFILDAGSWWRGRWWKSVQRPTPATWQPVGQELFYRQTLGVVGATCRTAELSLTVIFKSVIGGLTSIILIVLGTVNLQFQGPFVSISLRPVLRIVAVYVMSIVWSSCS